MQSCQKFRTLTFPKNPRNFFIFPFCCWVLGKNLFKNILVASSHCGSHSKEPNIVSVRMQVQSLISLSGLKIWHFCELQLGRRCSLDLVLLWLWCRLAAMSPIQPEPCAPCATRKRKKKKKRTAHFLKSKFFS